MKGLMTGRPLLISSIARHAELLHGDREIVSYTVDNPRHRYTYREAFARARQLAAALTRRGMRPGDRIATLAWNDYRHFEIYFGVSGSGLVCHTVNPRLFEDQIVYILDHAGDRMLFVDPVFLPLAEQILPRLDGAPEIVVLTDDAHLPDTTLDVTSYETLIAEESDGTDGTDRYEWPVFDEDTASSLCYTSGTTGNPKGALYSHRSTLLHSYASALPDAFCLGADDTVMPVVPMFHVNAWGLPYSAAMVGAKIVFPGPKMGDPAVLHSLIEDEGVTFTAGVPTVWQGLLDHLGSTGGTLDSLRRIVSGGSAVPFSLMEDYRTRHDVNVEHAWGMTEVSPLGTIFHPTPALRGQSPETQTTARASQGLPVFGAEFRLLDDDGGEVPHDGESVGSLQVRGPWVVSGYYRNDDRDAFDDDDWFTTGDVASISPLGYMHIADRSKDLIKSGGEWISSIDLENIAVAHPSVRQAAVIAMPDAKWQERPLLVIVPEEGTPVDAAELLGFFDGRVAKWWIPDAVAVTDAIPLTATGKISKLTLRKQLAAGEMDPQSRRQP